MFLLVTTLAVSSLVHCFPEPEAGLGVEHLHTLSRWKYEATEAENKLTNSSNLNKD